MIDSGDNRKEKERVECRVCREMKKTKILNNEATETEDTGTLEQSQSKAEAEENNQEEIEINNFEVSEGIEDEERYRKTPQPIEESKNEDIKRERDC